MDSGGERLRGRDLVDDSNDRGHSPGYPPNGSVDTPYDPSAPADTEAADTEAASNEADCYEADSYETDPDETGSYETDLGAYEADTYQSETYETGSAETATYKTEGDGAGERDADLGAPVSTTRNGQTPGRNPLYSHALHRGVRLPAGGVRRTAINLLITCTGADHRAVAERDRSRFASAGALMLLTAGLAAYAGASVAAFGFGTSTRAALPYGFFYAAFIFFIDRSVLLTVRPLHLVGKGDKERVRPWRLLPTGAVRIFIAVIGAILVGESLLLRFFDASIQPRVAELRQQELAGVLASWDAGQRGTEDRLVTDVDDRRAQLTSAENLVTTKTGEVDCQLTGGVGCLGGRGPIYQVKLDELRAAAAQIPALRAARDAAQSRLDTFRATRDQRRAQYAGAEWDQIKNSDDLLMREKGFWRLTASDNSVKVWRVLISLLVLGIDLAPLLFKRNLDRTSYARAERGVLWEGEINEEVDAYQLDRNARARRGRAGGVASRMAARYEEYALAREELRLAAVLDEDAEAAVLRREERRLGHDRQAADLRRAHRLPAPSPRGEAPAPHLREEVATPLLGEEVDHSADARAPG